MGTKALLWIVGGVFALAIATTLALYPRCEKPSAMMIRINLLQCVVEAMQSPTLMSKDTICKVLGKEPNCQISEADMPAINLYVNQTMSDCAKKKLAADNMCTDGVDQLMKELE